MSTHALLHRLLHRKGPAAGPSTVRLDVRPPDLWPARDPVWLGALRWLLRSEASVPRMLRTPLERARHEFVMALEGLLDLESSDLLCRAQHARSLRELWHLRSELYTLIARRIDQSEADLRLARVNRYFPTRATRAPLPATEVFDAQRSPA